VQFHSPSQRTENTNGHASGPSWTVAIARLASPRESKTEKPAADPKPPPRAFVHSVHKNYTRALPSTTHKPPFRRPLWLCFARSP